MPTCSRDYPSWARAWSSDEHSGRYATRRTRQQHAKRVLYRSGVARTVGQDGGTGAPDAGRLAAGCRAADVNGPSRAGRPQWHYIQFDRPDAVIMAIQDMLKRLRLLERSQAEMHLELSIGDLSV